MPTVANRVAVLHGVNFDVLEKRDASIYGGISLSELERQISDWAHGLALEPIFFHSNSEGEFCEYLHRAADLADAAIVNAGAWTHYSRAIADALELAGLPTVEITRPTSTGTTIVEVIPMTHVRPTSSAATPTSSQDATPRSRSHRGAAKTADICLSCSASSCTTGRTAPSSS